MAALFARLARAAGAVQDRLYSEDFLLEPLAHARDEAGALDVNARKRASAARTPLPFMGTFVAEGAVVHAQGRALGASMTRPVVAEQPMVDVPVADLPQAPREGDRIHRVGTGDLFVVTKYLPHDFGRAWIHLAAAKREPEQER